jgi:uncharacterized protein (DUF1697 family)
MASPRAKAAVLKKSVSQCIALLRGINVGRAKRISMSDLRDSFADLGYDNARTLLNSGNVVFETPRPNVGKLAAGIEAHIVSRFGFSTTVTVLTALVLSKIIAENPLLHVAKDFSRHLVAFAAKPDSLLALRSMQLESWEPDALAVTSRAAYLWCKTGILEGKLNQAFARKAAASVTTRNWATVLKLQAAATLQT